jgi:hypothetical protein
MPPGQDNRCQGRSGLRKDANRVNIVVLLKVNKKGTARKRRAVLFIRNGGSRDHPRFKFRKGKDHVQGAGKPAAEGHFPAVTGEKPVCKRQGSKRTGPKRSHQEFHRIKAEERDI